MRSAQERLIVSVDVALFTIAEGALCLVLTERKEAPYQGVPMLVGGPVQPAADDSSASAARRLLKETTGLESAFVEQLMTFAGPERDPRGWAVSIAYYALTPRALLASTPESTSLTLSPVDRLPRLAFDHDHIASVALKRLRGKSAYTSLPSLLLPQEFTFPELKAAYEIAMGTPLNDSAFRRKISDLDIIEEVPEAKTRATATHRRPAQLYRLKHCALVEFDRTV